MTVWRYAHCGLSVASEIELPELAVGDEVAVGDELAGSEQVRIERSLMAVPDPAEVLFQVSDHRCRIEVPGAGRLEVESGSRITVAAVAEPLIRQLILGSAWGALLHQRGSIPFHAAIVSGGQGAIAFCGPAGSGKSSAIAALLDRGYGLVSDDLTRLELPEDGGPPRVWPSTRRVKLSMESLDRTGWSGTGHDALTAEQPLGKFPVPWRGRAVLDPQPLAEVVILEWGEPRCVRLHGLGSARAFGSATAYRPQLLRASPAALARHWGQAIEIARRVRVHLLRRPRDWSCLEVPEFISDAY